MRKREREKKDRKVNNKDKDDEGLMSG